MFGIRSYGVFRWTGVLTTVFIEYVVLSKTLLIHIKHIWYPPFGCSFTAVQTVECRPFAANCRCSRLVCTWGIARGRKKYVRQKYCQSTKEAADNVAREVDSAWPVKCNRYSKKRRKNNTAQPKPPQCNRKTRLVEHPIRGDADSGAVCMSELEHVCAPAEKPQHLRHHHLADCCALTDNQSAPDTHHALASACCCGCFSRSASGRLVLHPSWSPHHLHETWGSASILQHQGPIKRRI